MSSMVVTLEVSKLRGWLNDAAPCRESKGRACGVGRGMRVGRRGTAGNRGASSVQAQERARMQIRGMARGGAHREHVARACDAGGVEAQRLVERRRALLRVEREGMWCGARYAGRQAGEAAGDGGARSVQARARL